jgi:hypothetical protein
MSVAAFLSDDTYQRGNHHYNGRIAGRYASTVQEAPKDPTRQGVDYVIDKLPQMIGMYYLYKAIGDAGDSVVNRVLNSPPAVESMDLGKVALAVGLPATIISGYLNAIGKTSPKGLIASALRAAKR